MLGDAELKKLIDNGEGSLQLKEEDELAPSFIEILRYLGIACANIDQSLIHLRLLMVAVYQLLDPSC